MSIEKFEPSYDVYSARLEKLKAAVPEAFADGKINWEVLKECLGELNEDEGADREHYAFTWPGKKDARRLAAKPPQGTLVPAPGEGVDEDKTNNIFIEGDNLEVLKLLQKSYAERVKMIYIDPPYNTGNDFIYNDNFTQPLDEYLKMTGQIDAEGNPLVSNKKSDGRFHSKWMNMIFPRLLLARNLLREDGLIFISIDDNEVDNLKKVCGEIFGEENFEGHIHWRRRHNQPNDPTKMIGLVAEHILAYSKNKEFFKQSGVGKIGLTGKFSNPDNDTRGPWASKPWKVGSDQSGSRYEIRTPAGKVYSEEWMGDENNFKQLLNDNRIIFPDNGSGSPRKKYFKFEREEEGQCATNWWPHDQFGHNQGANSLMEELMGVKNVFSNPKPPELIENLMEIANLKANDICLDFFAGSCTTAHSSWLLSRKKEFVCRFILIQLPEAIDKDDKDFRSSYDFCITNKLLPNIAEIGKERLRRAIKKLSIDGAFDIGTVDFGFRVYKLQRSSFKIWKDYDGKDVAELTDLFAQQDRPLVDSWRPEDLIVELLLHEKFPLNSKIIEVVGIKTNQVHQVISELCEHSLYVCFDKNVSADTIKMLPLSDKDIFICLDSALTDEQKVALSDKGLIKTI